MTYAALWTKSNFSFLEGASHPDELVEQAHRHGLAALALVDRDGVYGAVRAHVKARELGVALIHGSQVTLDDASKIVLLAQSRAGYANLCQLITIGRLRSPKGSSSVRWTEVCAHADGVFALWDLARGDASNSSATYADAAREAERRAGQLREAFGERAYAMCARRRCAEDIASEALLRERARRFGMPLVAANEVLYHRAERRRLQDVLTSIRHGVALSKAGRRLASNAEHDLKSPHAFELLFDDDRAALERTREIADACRFGLDQIRYRYPSERLPDGQTSSQWLRKLCFEGARSRYGDELPEAARAQIERELELIDELDYCGYFLTMREIVEFCRTRGILCQGRGSAANSAVCYCLGVTAIDPVRMGLLFERFLSRERAEPPDIDLDIEHERREEVIQHVYDKYGRSHAAMVANVIRYRARSSVRDVGKALSFPESLLSRLTRLLSHGEGLTVEVLREAGLATDSVETRLLLDLCDQIEDFPRHLSIHPGGFLLGHEPIADLVPVENAAMERRTVIQWDKDDVEAIGLFKVDLLGLGALHHLHRCFDLLREHRGLELSMASIPPDDPETFDAICRADTVGVFQIESRAQMAMLPRLRPRNYYDLVIEISIVRPGPITGGMVHPYLRRRSGAEAVVYPHECLRPVLEKTLGVPLFQEQVMKLAMTAADYTPGEADQLRRDMAAWRKSGRIGHHRERLVQRMQRKGIATEFAERVFQQICGFGEYGFPESHAASFALISYAGAWLKRHYPAEFACGLLNAQPMGFYTAATILEDAQRHGVRVNPVDVQHSVWDCRLEGASGAVERRPNDDLGEPNSDSIRMGLKTVKGFGLSNWMEVARARESGRFLSLEDFEARTRLDRKCMSALAEAGAFQSLEEHRRSALWSCRATPARPAAQLFRDSATASHLPRLERIEEIQWDYHSTGHSTNGHPLSALREDLDAQGLPVAADLRSLGHGRTARYAGLVICRQRPGTASGVTFMTLEDESGFVNVVVWPTVFEKHRLLLRTENFLGVTGHLQNQEGVQHLIATRFWRPELGQTPATLRSRDFH